MNLYQLPDGRILDFPAHCTALREPFTLSTVPRLVVDAAKVTGLIAVPAICFGRTMVERWEKGSHGDRRVRQLRSIGITVTTRTCRDTRKLWSEPGADRITVEVTEIVYVLPRGRETPPLISVPQIAA